jgi:hypothetical protein
MYGRSHQTPSRKSSLVALMPIVLHLGCSGPSDDLQGVTFSGLEDLVEVAGCAVEDEAEGDPSAGANDSGGYGYGWDSGAYGYAWDSGAYGYAWDSGTFGDPPTADLSSCDVPDSETTGGSFCIQAGADASFDAGTLEDLCRSESFLGEYYEGQGCPRGSTQKCGDESVTLYNYYSGEEDDPAMDPAEFEALCQAAEFSDGSFTATTVYRKRPPQRAGACRSAETVDEVQTGGCIRGGSAGAGLILFLVALPRVAGRRRGDHSC